MGVSGSGKSTLGRALAQSLGWDFIEGDDYHPRSNIEKMRAGLPLTEDDRSPWLERLHDVTALIEKQCGNAVLSCSALKKSHRYLLAQGLPAIRFVFLYGDPKLIRERLRARKHDFMPPELLVSVNK
jgi:gluconokinase